MPSRTLMRFPEWVCDPSNWDIPELLWLAPLCIIQTRVNLAYKILTPEPRDVTSIGVVDNHALCVDFNKFLYPLCTLSHSFFFPKLKKEPVSRWGCLIPPSFHQNHHSEIISPTLTLIWGNQIQYRSWDLTDYDCPYSTVTMLSKDSMGSSLIVVTFLKPTLKQHTFSFCPSPLP